jgi:outer membrane protein assembly factor BamB
MMAVMRPTTSGCAAATFCAWRLTRVPLRLLITRMDSKKLLVLAFASAFAFSASAADFKGIGKQDWPWWRGPNHNGVAAEGQDPPLRWSEDRNVVWKAPIPGRGHGSATVVGRHVYLPTADEANQTQSILCLDRATGKQVWQSVLHKGAFNQERQKRSTWASSTIACDGERLFLTLFNRGAIHAYALDLAGKKLWETRIVDFVSHQGYGASPLVYKSLVLVTADTKAPGGGAIAGLDRKTGEIVWKAGRPELPNYSSPVVFHLAGKDQLIVTGCDLISSFAPLTGEKLWEFKGATTECVVTAVTDGVRVFTGGGYPRNHTMAMRADGSGRVDWQNKQRVYVPSMIAKDGHLHAVADAGFALCWDSANGQEKWKERLGGSFFASPTMVGERIYASSVSGTTYVYQATPREFKLLAENKLGDETYASPVICGDRIYLRIAKDANGRQEFLYCIGRK